MSRAVSKKEPQVRHPATTHHALFRPPDGAFFPPEKFERIYIARVTQTGELEEAPGWLSPEDLTDTDKLRERFGGGVYELRAIRFDGSLYRKTRTNRIAGAPKPLVPLVSEEDDGELRIPTPQQNQQGPTSEMGMIVPLFQWMISESGKANERMMMMMQQNAVAMAQAQSQNTQVLVAALSGQRVDVGAIVASVAETMRTAQGPAPAPANPIGDAERLIDLSKKLSAPAPKEESIGEIVGAAAQALGAVGMMAQAQQQSAPSLPPNGGTKPQGPAG